MTLSTLRQPSRPSLLDATAGWTFLSNHAHVLVCLARDPQVRLRDVAAYVGVTERAVQKIVSELESSGFITRERVGRCNRYMIHGHLALRHPLESHRCIGDLLALVEAGTARQHADQGVA